ncbi:unnamed protein product, partial [Allacma fusca]
VKLKFLFTADEDQQNLAREKKIISKCHVRNKGNLEAEILEYYI